MKSIRIGVIGAGANTRLRHIPGFQAIESVAVDVVCNRTQESGERVAEEFGIPRVTTSWEEVVSDSSLDAICIGTWPYMHASITIAALEQGKHVLTEARMAMNAKEAKRMLAASKANPKLVTQVVPPPFTLDWDSLIVDKISTGELGDLREVNVVKTAPASADSAAPMNWRQSYEYSGHNTMMLGIYYEMVRRWLRCDPAKVWANGEIYTKRRIDPESGEEKGIRIADTIDFIALYDKGLRLSGHMSFIEIGAPRDEIRINGSKASLRIDVTSGRVFQCALGGCEEELEVPQRERMGWQVEADFIDSIRNGTPVTLTSFEDGLAYMRFTDAAFVSLERGGEWQAM